MCSIEIQLLLWICEVQIIINHINQYQKYYIYSIHEKREL